MEKIKTNKKKGGLLFFITGALAILYVVMNAFSLVSPNIFDVINKITWQETKAKIVRLNLKEHSYNYDREDGIKNYYIVRLSYSYQVNGHNYENNKIAFLQRLKVEKPEDIKRVKSLYAQGKTVSVSYDPNKPEISTLEMPSIFELLKANIINSFIFIPMAISIFFMFI